MKQIIVFLFILLTAASVYAQENYFQVITCKGSVLYAGEEDGERTVVPGARIPAQGNLILSDGSMVKIISKDRPQKLQAPGTYDLSELYYASDKKSMSFTGKFWNYLMKGLHSSDSKSDIKKYGKQSASGGIKGFNTLASSEVKILSPVVGKISKLPIHFEWQGQSAQFKIIDSKNAIVLEKETSDEGITLSTTDIDLLPGTYYWQVVVNDRTSPIIPFEYQPLAESNMGSKLSRITDYVEGSELEKSWIRAVVYEMEGYIYEAGLMYNQLVADNADNLLIKKLYILYLARNGNIAKAETLMD